MTDWIPCSERMPPDGELVLIADAGVVREADYVAHRERWYWSADGSSKLDEVTHWMPLPYPPTASE